MDKHHTSIYLVSEVGVGSTFWFDLAVFQERSAMMANQPVVEVAKTVTEDTPVKVV
jgi:two-component system sensor histidine kinase NblS